jgi:putative PIN family toxin of toxin-antitoxin system
MCYHGAVAAQRAVIDTNVLTGALLRQQGQNRAVLRACFGDRLRPVLGQKLFLEYEDVLGRAGLFRNSPLSAVEREQLFEAFLSVCEWVQVYYLWRPNLRDEGDNHLVELAVAGAASVIVTNNVADFRASELRFPDIRVLRPGDLLKELS